ncbi:hypothetical protein HMPREF1985_02362, partial [Mitsuokella sp. oral taxon 131 str. W9106]
MGIVINGIQNFGGGIIHRLFLLFAIAAGQSHRKSLHFVVFVRFPWLYGSISDVSLQDFSHTFSEGGRLMPRIRNLLVLALLSAGLLAGLPHHAL